MKKIVSIIALFILLGGIIFSEEDFDALFTLGYSVEKASLDNVSFYNSGEALIGFEMMDLTKPVSFFGYGYGASLGVGCGLTDKSDTVSPYRNLKGNKKGFCFSGYFELGPAIGLYLGDVVRIVSDLFLRIQFKRDVPFNYKDSKLRCNASISNGSVGFSLGVQAKFLPNKKINPVIGWKFASCYSSEVTVNLNGSKRDFDYPKEKYKVNYNLKQNVFYAGIIIGV